MKEWLDDGEYYDNFDDDVEELVVEYEYKYDDSYWAGLGWHEKIMEVLDVIVGKDKWKDNSDAFTFYVN